MQPPRTPPYAAAEEPAETAESAVGPEEQLLTVWTLGREVQEHIGAKTVVLAETGAQTSVRRRAGVLRLFVVHGGRCWCGLGPACQGLAWQQDSEADTTGRGLRLRERQSFLTIFKAVSGHPNGARGAAPQQGAHSSMPLPPPALRSPLDCQARPRSPR